MRKIFLFVAILLAGFMANAQAPVQVEQPYMFLKWISVHDSIRGAIFLQGGDTMATQAYARGFAGAGVGYGIKRAGGNITLDTAVARKMDSAYAVNDSTIGFKINGHLYTFLIRGRYAPGTPCTGCLLASNNLSDISNTTTARTNLGLGTAATLDFPPTGNANVSQVVLGSDTRLAANSPPGSDQELIFNDGGNFGADGNFTFSKAFRESCLGCNVSYGDAHFDGGGAVNGALFLSSQNGPVWLTGDTATVRSTAGSTNIVRFMTNNVERFKVDNSGNVFFPGLASNSDTTAWKPMVLNPSTKAATYLDHWPVGAGGGFTNPMTTAGDFIYGNTGGAPLRLPPGTGSQILHSGTTPGWGAVNLATEVSGTLDSIRLPATGVVYGTYGDASHIPQVQVNTRGQIIGIGSLAATIDWSHITSIPSFGSLALLNTVNNSNWAGTVLSVANGGTGTATPGLVAGTNVTITGSWPNQTINSTGGGGGTPGGSSNDVQVNISGSFANVTHFTANSSTKVVNADTITTHKVRPDSVQINPARPLLDSIRIYGTSISVGIGASSAPYRYSTLVCNKLGALESNFAISGASLTIEGLAELNTIPQYSNSIYRWMILEWGVNDCQLGVTDSTTFSNAYKRFIDTCLARGWPASRILVLSPSYINPTLGSATFARQLQFRQAVASVAVSRSTKYLDIYDIEVAHGADLMLYDLIHPNDYGISAAYVTPITALLQDSVMGQGQALQVNGLSEFQKIRLRITDTMKYGGFVLGSNPDGTMGRYSTDGIILNSTMLPTAQAANFNLKGKGWLGASTYNGAENLNVAGGTRTGFLTISEGLASGVTGSKGELSIVAGGLYIGSYDRTTNTSLPFWLGGSLSGNTIIGAFSDDGIHRFQVNGDTKITGNFTQATGSSQFGGAVNFAFTSENFEPAGTTAQRIGTIQASFRFNTDSLRFEYYDGISWKCLRSTWDVVGSSFSLAAVGSAGSSNANGATYTGGVFNLNYANTSFPGVLDTARWRLLDSIYNGTWSVAHPFTFKLGNEFAAGGVRGDSLYSPADSLPYVSHIQLSIGGNIQERVKGVYTTRFTVTDLFPSQTSNANKFLTNNGSGTLRWDTIPIYDGLYTPAISNTTNISASTMHECQFSKNGNSWEVSGYFTVTPTLTATVTTFDLSLPISTGFADIGKCGGTAENGAIGLGAQISANVGTGNAQVKFLSIGTGSVDLFFKLQFRYSAP